MTIILITTANKARKTTFNKDKTSTLAIETLLTIKLKLSL